MALPMQVHNYAKLVVDQPTLVFAAVPVAVLGATFYADSRKDLRRERLASALCGSLIVNTVLFGVVGNMYNVINAKEYPPNILDLIGPYYIYPSQFQIPREPRVLWLLMCTLISALTLLNRAHLVGSTLQALVAFVAGSAALWLGMFICNLKGYSAMSLSDD